MKNVKQSIKGNNNLQIVTNNAPIIHTGNLNAKVEVTVAHNPENHITLAQATEVKQKVTELASLYKYDTVNEGSPFGRAYAIVYRNFNVPSYKLLAKEDFEPALKLLQKEIAIARRFLKNNNTEEWRKALYKSINARGRQMGMDREALLIYATQVLGLADTLSSLKDLEDDQLQKLYNKMFGKR
jgi:hypothetical protein